MEHGARGDNNETRSGLRQVGDRRTWIIKFSDHGKSSHVQRNCSHQHFVSQLA